MTPDTSIGSAHSVETQHSEHNPAKDYLESVIRPLLGDEITNFWSSQADTWNQRFAKKTLANFMVGVGEIPSTKATTDQEATPLVKFQLEHWMMGANIHVAGNLTIASASAAILAKRDKPNASTDIETMLNSMGGAQARIRWEKHHNQVLRKLDRQIAKAPDATTMEELQKKVHAENDRYKSPLAQINFLQRSQKAYRTNRLKVLSQDPEKFYTSIRNKHDQAFTEFNSYAEHTNIILGRDDRGFFDINFYHGPWKQLGLAEDPLRKGHEPKGISVTFYKFNPETGQKEFFTCWGKRDAFARTHQLTPAWQTSWTRIEQGNHPGQEYNPILNSLKEAFSTAYAANGVEISYVDLNANRHESSPIAVATINWDSYSPEDQATILDIMEKENKAVRHSWISEAKLAQLRRSGMIDEDGEISPAINGFLAISIGSRSPTEILLDAVGRTSIQQASALLEQYDVKEIETEAFRLLEYPSTYALGQLTLTWIQIMATYHTRVEQITQQFPHTPHELNAQNPN